MAEPAPPPRRGLVRVLQNAGWLLGGKAVGAVLSLIYLALATRTLGPRGFGEFTLILGTAQALAAFIGFQCWQVVLHFGVRRLQDASDEALRRLVTFCTGLDIAGALIGCALAALTVALLQGPLGWSPAVAREAFLFCCVMLLAARSTAIGMLRLKDRYGVGAAAEAILPVMRLAGAVAAVVAGASVRGFLIAWAVAEVVTTLFTWAAAIGFTALRPGLPRPDALRAARHENPGLVRYALVTNAQTTLGAAGKQFAVLLVGVMVGPVAAGSYRLAHQLGQALARLSAILARAMFGEFAHAHAGETRDELKRLFRDVSKLAVVAAVAVILVLVVLGKPALGLIAGPEYLAAYPLLLLLGAAAALDLAGVGFEPALMATGRAGQALKLRAVATLFLVPLLIVLLSAGGVIGAGWAVLAASLFGLLLFSVAAWRAVHAPR